MSNSKETTTPNAVAEQAVTLNPVDWPLPNLRKASLADVTIGGKPYSEIVNADKGKGKGKGKAKGKVTKVNGPLAKYDRILRLAESEFAKGDLERVAAEKPLSNQPIPDRLAKSLSVWAKVNGSGDPKLDRASHKAFCDALDKTRQVKMPDGHSATLRVTSVKYVKPQGEAGIPTAVRYGATLHRQLELSERMEFARRHQSAIHTWIKANS